MSHVSAEDHPVRYCPRPSTPYKIFLRLERFLPPMDESAVLSVRAGTHFTKDAAAMLTSDLGACEWFISDLRRSNLIDRGQLEGIVGDFLNRHPGVEPPALAEYLVSQGILTPFQSERLLQGKTEGFVLGPYTLMDALGSGSMGTVYKALNKTNQRWYAVKVLPRRSMWNVRIARRKVRAFEHCQHPAVVPFIDVGTSGGMHYLSWPLVEGEPLDRVMERQGKPGPATAAMYIMQAAAGLELCHRQELFHGLLKPSNLMIGPDEQVHILDFGIGCLLAETEGESLVDTMSTANSVASGLDCASPESIMDPTNLTPVGDQYSLGCVLYFCLTGKYPFPDGTAAEKMMAHQMKQPTPVRELNAEVPEALAAVVERLMQKSLEARYGSMADLIEALRPLAAPSPVPAPARALPRPNGLRDSRSERRPLMSPPATATLSALHHEAPRSPLHSQGAPSASLPPRSAAASAVLPTRQALNNASTAPAPKGDSTSSQSLASSSRQVPSFATQPQNMPQRSWEDRLGPAGIAFCAMAACALAWLVTYKFF